MFDLKMRSKRAKIYHEKLRKKNRRSTILVDFSKISKKNGDSGDKMVTSVTGIFNRDKIPENSVFTQVCGTLMNIVENNT